MVFQVPLSNGLVAQTTLYQPGLIAMLLSDMSGQDILPLNGAIALLALVGFVVPAVMDRSHMPAEHSRKHHRLADTTSAEAPPWRGT